MDDRQRQFVQFATALNQYASSNPGNGDRGPRERTTVDGRSSTGSTSSGSSSSSGNAAAALWGDLSRAFPFNYSGFSSGSGWPPSTHQGGSDFHRYGGYGGFNEGPSENRATVENRAEVRRVPSKGETKATPPLPAGLSPNVGSAFASLMGIPILAQQYAAAAAFSALPPSTRPSLSPIPPTAGRSSISPTTGPPTQLHGSPPPVPPSRHHPQYQRQRQHLPTQQKSSPPLPLLSTVGGHPHPDGGNLNGEYLEPGMRGEHPAQLSPLMRKDRHLDHGPDSLQAGLRPSPNPTPPKSSPISPVGRLTPHGENEREQQQQHPYSAFYTSEKHPPHHPGAHGEMNQRGQDPGGRSGSESEGDQRVRHRRKQDQPRRQTVIYSNPGPGYSGPPMDAPPGGGPLPSNPCHAPSSASAEESSSDDSQGYDAPLPRPPNNNPATADPLMKEGSPVTGGASSLTGDSAPQLPISQAMSHALSHPFLAAHLNASAHNTFLERNPKGDQHSASSHYSRGEYDPGIPPPDTGKDHGVGGGHCYKEFDGGVGLQPHHHKAHNNVQYSHHHHSHYKGGGGSSYSVKNPNKDPGGSYYRVEREQQPTMVGKDDYSALLGTQHPPGSVSSQHLSKDHPKGSLYDHGDNHPSLDAKKEAVSKMGSFHHHHHHETAETQESGSDLSRTPTSASAKVHFTPSSADSEGAPPPTFSFTPPSSTPSYVGGDRTQKMHDASHFRYGEECHLNNKETDVASVHYSKTSFDYPGGKNSPSPSLDREGSSRLLRKEDPNDRLGSVHPLSSSESNKPMDTVCTSNGTNTTTQSCVATGSNPSSSNVMPSVHSEQCCLDSEKRITASPAVSNESPSNMLSTTSSAESTSVVSKTDGSEAKKPQTGHNHQPSPLPPPQDGQAKDDAGKSELPNTSVAVSESESNIRANNIPSSQDDPNLALVNGTASPSPNEDGHKRGTPAKSPPQDSEEKDKDRSLPMTKDSASELVNGNLEHILSPCKHKKRRTECEMVEDTAGELCETKRRTRQKRPVSYVEDETDPVLEMNEDMYPLLSPVKKRGRRCKEKSEVESAAHPPPFEQSANNNSASKDLRLQVYGSNCLNEATPHPRLSSGDPCDASGPGNLQARDRLLQLSGKVPPNLAEPLHIDTSGAFKSSFRNPGPQPVTPTLHSPDIYDFHDGEGDLAVRGGKGKRGRKRGSPKKQGRVTPEYMRSNLSPRFREGSCSRSPRSPKFFTNARSPSEGMTLDRLRLMSSSSGGLDEDPGATEARISNGNLLPIITPQESPFCRFPLAPGPSQSLSDIPSKTLEMGPPTSHGTGSPSVLAPIIAPPSSSSSNSKIVDEVEKQLAALHKEHLPETSSESSHLAQDPLMALPGNLTAPLEEKKSSPVLSEAKPVHKPMLSVVPLEQLTYEGLRNKGASKREPFKCNDLERITKSPSGFFTAEPASYSVTPNPVMALDEEDRFSPEVQQQQDPLALPSPLGDLSSSLDPANDKLNFDVVDSNPNPSPSLHYPENSFGSDTAFVKRGFRGRRPYRSARSRAKEAALPFSDNELDSFKGLPEDTLQVKETSAYMGGIGGPVDPQIIDRVAASIPVTEQSVHVVSVSDVAPTVGTGGRKRGGGRGRSSTGTSSSPSSATGEAERPRGAYSNHNSSSANSTNSTTATTTTTTATNSAITTTSTTQAQPGSTPATTNNNNNNNIANANNEDDRRRTGEASHLNNSSSASRTETESPQPRLRRRSRRGANPRIEADGSPTSSPPQLSTFPGPPSRGEDSSTAPSTTVFDNRVPPSHRETMEAEMEASSGVRGEVLDPQQESQISPVRNAVAMEPEEGETLEDIAKFLEATAPSSGGGIGEAANRLLGPHGASPSSKNNNSSLLSEGFSSSASSSANVSMVSASTDTTPSGTGGGAASSTYREGRPKRVSRPPPQMNDGEMNDLLLLLNMEDEESEDEDYIPREAEDEDEEDDLESDGRDTAEEGDRFDAFDGEDDDEDGEEGPGEARKKSRVASSHTGMDNGPSSLRSPPPRKKGTAKKSISKKAKEKVVKAPPRRKGPDEGERRREEKGDRRGPIVRLIPDGDEPEVILNAPDREDEEQEKARKAAAPFSLDASSVPEGSGGSRGLTKVGFNSTLHNNYDAFNKDLHWFCAFCKNYSHFGTLGDLFGPFYIKGLTVAKKSYPDVVDGQIADKTQSPAQCSSALLDGHVVGPPCKQKNKRTPRPESSCSESLALEAKRVEMGSCSPPSRFVPAATPARMLGRGGATSSSPRVPLHSPLRSPSSAPTGESGGGTNPAPNTTTTRGATCLGTDPSPTSSAGETTSPPGTECWLHEMCVLWASGVTVVNSKLYGLEEALIAAQDSTCIHCGESGATVSCLKRGCSGLVHVPCARLLRWSLDAHSFQSFCPKHAVVSTKKGTFCSSRKGSNSNRSLNK